MICGWVHWMCVRVCACVCARVSRVVMQCVGGSSGTHVIGRWVKSTCPLLCRPHPQVKFAFLYMLDPSSMERGKRVWGGGEIRETCLPHAHLRTVVPDRMHDAHHHVLQLEE